MSIISKHLGLYTDFYELTMAQGYLFHKKENEQASFDYFFRTNPFKGGFTVFAGLHDLLELVTAFKFSLDDIAYLKEQGLNDRFLEYLKDFKFRGDIYSVKEGEIIFPNVPVVRVDGNLIECQLIESLLLNILNFETLVATKAYRIKHISGKAVFSDFGLRRAQGYGALHASRAACIGGASSTSNVLAGKLFNIPVSGTQAHSWIQSFESELKAFRAYAQTFPENTILLVDTFDTLKSGVPNAITVAKEMEQEGHRLKAIRLDSGDLAYLSKKARKMLDAAGLKYVSIIASNQLNEFVINSLLHDQKAPIDAFGVGTELSTGKSDAALDGVYKLSEIKGIPKMKLSDNIEKVTLPGKKQLIRYFDGEGKFYHDAIIGMDEKPDDIQILYHPIYPEKNCRVEHLKHEILLNKAMEKGEIIIKKKSLASIHEYLMKRAKLLPLEHKRFISPHIYKVGISKKLMETRNALTKQLKTLPE
jgi:nicotinate phosphoribosyltransferase